MALAVSIFPKVLLQCTIYKGGIISENFSLQLKSKKKCQATLLFRWSGYFLGGFAVQENSRSVETLRFLFDETSKGL